MARGDCRYGDIGTCQHPECSITDDELAALTPRAVTPRNDDPQPDTLRPVDLPEQEVREP